MPSAIHTAVRLSLSLSAKRSPASSTHTDGTVYHRIPCECTLSVPCVYPVCTAYPVHTGYSPDCMPVVCMFISMPVCKLVVCTFVSTLVCTLVCSSVGPSARICSSYELVVYAACETLDWCSGIFVASSERSTVLFWRRW